MAVDGSPRTAAELEQLLVDIRLRSRQLEVADERRDPGLEQILADIRLKNRQHTTEVWKVVIAALAAGAIAGGLMVQLLNMTR